VKRLALALAALLPAGAAIRLPAIALAGGAVVALVFRARLHPGIDAATFAAGLAAAQAWWLAAVVAAGLPPLAVRATERGGTPHHGPLARLHEAPAAALGSSAIVAAVTLAAGLPVLLLAAAYGGPAMILRGLAPAMAAVAATLGVAGLSRRLAPPLHLATHYTVLTLMAVTLWRWVG